MIFFLDYSNHRTLTFIEESEEEEEGNESGTEKEKKDVVVEGVEATTEKLKELEVKEK